MTNMIVTIAEVVGTIGFLVALAFSVSNYRKTKEASTLWFFISFAMLLHAIICITNVLEWSGIAPIFDPLGDSLLVGTATLWICAAYVFSREILKPV